MFLKQYAKYEELKTSLNDERTPINEFTKLPNNATTFLVDNTYPK